MKDPARYWLAGVPLKGVFFTEFCYLHSMVVLHHMNLAKLELHFLEFPSLSGPMLGLDTGEMYVRFGR